MQPTVEAELAGLRRTLESLGDGATLPPGVAAELADAARTLQRLERSCSRVLPYLMADNAATVVLLRELAPSVPDALRQEIEGALAAEGSSPRPPTLEIAPANERNELLRALLSKVVLALPSEPLPAAAMRKRIAVALRQGLEMRPW